MTQKIVLFPLFLFACENTNLQYPSSDIVDSGITMQDDTDSSNAEGDDIESNDIESEDNNSCSNSDSNNTGTEDTNRSDENSPDETGDTSEIEEEIDEEIEEEIDEDGDGIVASEDCDDNNSSMPLEDADCDGYLTVDDCNDNDNTINPDAADNSEDGTDQNCDGVDGYGTSTVTCAAGEIADCQGNCAPADWIGDGWCDDGFGWWGGHHIYFNCPQFNNDDGDC